MSTSGSPSYHLLMSQPVITCGLQFKVISTSRGQELSITAREPLIFPVLYAGTHYTDLYSPKSVTEYYVYNMKLNRKKTLLQTEYISQPTLLLSTYHLTNLSLRVATASASSATSLTPILDTAQRFQRNIQGGPAKVRPTYIFDGNI